MKKLFSVSLSAFLIISTFFALPVSSAAAKGPKILKFDTMVGVPAGLIGALSQGPLRGINGGGIPWTVADASAELRANGHVKISVEGLVLAEAPMPVRTPVPPSAGWSVV